MTVTPDRSAQAPFAPSAQLLASMREIGALLQQGDIRSAHARLAEIVQAHPDYPEALRLFAGTQQALGDVAGAEALLRRAVALDPGWTPTLAALGELLLASGRAQEAKPLLQRAAQKLPRAAFVLARHYNNTQRADLALAVIAPHCAQDVFDADLATQHIAALGNLGRVEEAIEFYGAPLRAENPVARHAYAIALSAANRHADAAATAQHAVAGGYRSAALLNTQARSLIALGDFVRAETVLRESVELDPRAVDAQNNLAQLIWMRSGDSAQATCELDRALRVHAHDDSLWAAKAAVLQGAGDARGAYSCLAEQAGRAQAAPSLLIRAGLAALEFDSATARNLAERALRNAPQSTVARSLLVAALLGLGDAQDALRHCNELLAAAPNDQYFIALQTTAWRLLDDSRYAQFCNYAELVVSMQLEPPAQWKDDASFFADLKRSLERLHDPQGHALLFQSLRNGTETTQDLTHNDDPAIRALFHSFDAPIREYLARMGHGADPLRRRNHGTYRFNGSWSVRLRAQGFHNQHVHPRGWISSACYIELPSAHSTNDEEGDLTFGQPSFRTTPALDSEYRVRPQVGMLVLFPSYFWHGTVPITGHETRLTVAFDVIPDA